jgi:dihydroorotase
VLLKDCKIIRSGEILTADILIEGEKIAKIGKDLRGEEVVNMRGRPVIPGIVDVHVHMRDFGEGYKEDFFSGSRAALAGGVTTFVDMPNSSPPVVDAGTFEKRIKEAERKSLVDFGLNLGITSENLEEIKKVDPVACKIYMDGTLGEIEEEVLRDAIEKCPRVAVHAEDAGIIKRNLEYFKGKGGFLVHGHIREPKAEEEAVKKVSQIAAMLEKPIHLCHISYRKSLNHLNRFTTCEATPHHLLLTETELKELEGVAKTNPPLRSPRDVKALWGALKNGRIDVIASDHAPHAEDEKEEEVAVAPSGVPNLDVMLRLFLTLVNKGTLTLFDVVRLMCENPAKIFGIDKGEIKEGRDADLLVLNLREKGKIEADEFYSKAKYSPFEGWRTKGDVERVFLRGRLAFEDGEFMVKKGYGKWIGGA